MFFNNVPAAPREQRKQAMFRIPEIMRLCAPWVLICVLIRRSPFHAADAFADIGEFSQRGMRKANAIGDALGVRGFGLYRDGVSYAPTMHNASRVLAVIPRDQHEALAIEVGFQNAQELYLAVAALEFCELPLDEQGRIARDLTFESAEEAQAAMDALVYPTV